MFFAWFEVEKYTSIDFDYFVIKKSDFIVCEKMIFI